MSLPQLPEMQHIMVRGIATGILTEAQTKAYGQACREQALLDAMNATLPFGKVGIVIASAIRSLK